MLLGHLEDLFLPHAAMDLCIEVSREVASGRHRKGLVPHHGLHSLWEVLFLRFPDRRQEIIDNLMGLLFEELNPKVRVLSTIVCFQLCFYFSSSPLIAVIWGQAWDTLLGRLDHLMRTCLAEVLQFGVHLQHRWALSIDDALELLFLSLRVPSWVATPLCDELVPRFPAWGSSIITWIPRKFAGSCEF